MIFCKAKASQVGYWRCIFKCLEVVFELQINLAKIEIF